jgi:hypothetical protein
MSKKRYRQKPAFVEAWEYTYDDRPIETWLGDWFETWIPSKRQLVLRDQFGEVVAHEGYYIVRDADGLFAAWPPDIFHETFEEVENG